MAYEGWSIDWSVYERGSWMGLSAWTFFMPSDINNRSCTQSHSWTHNFPSLLKKTKQNKNKKQNKTKQNKTKKKKTSEIPIFGTLLAKKINFGLDFAENQYFQVGHVLLRHYDVIHWPIFMILVSMERGDPTLYHGTKHLYFGSVNFKITGGCNHPLRKTCYKKCSGRPGLKEYVYNKYIITKHIMGKNHGFSESNVFHFWSDW